MATIREKLLEMFDTAREVNEVLWMSGIDPAHVSLPQLIAHVTQICKVEIKIRYVDVETDHIYGHIERYEDGKRAIIYVVKNIPGRYIPAVIIKELCQLLLDTREDWQPDGKDTLQRLVVQSPEIDAPDQYAVRSERVAEYLSWEIAYPFEIRRDDLAAKTPVEVIAARVRLPHDIVEYVLSEPYMQWCDGWWRLVYQLHQERIAVARAQSVPQ